MPDPRSTPAEAPLSGAPDDCSTAAGAETLADLGEWELIRRLGAFAPPGQFADDAALLPLGDATSGRAQAGRCRGHGDETLVINTDVLVEGIHFSDATTAAADVGWRAAAANLSDLAAMGCTQVVGLTVALVAPADTPWPWVEGVYRGLSEALRCHGGVLLGGDCSAGAQRLLAITALGRLPSALASAHTWPQEQGLPESCSDGSQARASAQDRAAWGAMGASRRGPTGPDAIWGAIRRCDGRPGDRLLCTGAHGLSRLGLALLQGELTGAGAARTAVASGGGAGPGHQDAAPPSLEPALVQRAIKAHRRPVPRFDAVRSLIGCRPSGLHWRVGGCDSSDGLMAAVAAIGAASGCSARLERSGLPLDPAMARLPQAEAWCLGGGEDFELVLALEPCWAEALVRALPGASLIGQLMAGAPGRLFWADADGEHPEPIAAAEGFQHFA